MEEFIKILNKFLQEERTSKGIKCNSFFVEHKQIIPNSTFKAIKDYIVTINIVKQEENPIVLCKYKHTFNASQTSQEEVYREITEDVILNLLKIIHSVDWVDILSGNYETHIK